MDELEQYLADTDVPDIDVKEEEGKRGELRLPSFVCVLMRCINVQMQ